MKKLSIAILALLLLLPTTLAVSAGEGVMTDDELYAEIDRELRRDRARGGLILDMDEGLTVAEWEAALTELGIPTDFACEYLYLSGQTTDPEAEDYGNFTVMVPEELLRDVLFWANRSEAFENVGLNLFVTTGETPHPMGDVVGDYEVDAKDYMVAKSAVLGKTEIDEELADVDYDGKLDAKDYMILKAAILGKSELSGRPAPADMTEEQLEHWLDEQERYAEDSNKRILFLKADVNAEEVTSAIGGEYGVLYSSAEHYPDSALWLVVDIAREDYREVIKNIALCDLLDEWGRLWQ